VVVTLQVQPGLNIREDSVASIESQGLTGATYVEISGGTKNSPILEAKSGQRYPVIRAKQSTLQQLEQSAPEVVAKLNVAASRLNDLLNDNNRRAITHILVNLDQTTSTIAKRSADIDAALKNANQATANLRDASQDLRPTIADADATVKKYGKVADDADAFINGDGLAQLSELISETRRLVASLTKFSDQLNRDPSKLLFGDRRKGYEPK
jgi:phospholipid/cholesterol/gamma-HCH transport system substrate-binding protein